MSVDEKCIELARHFLDDIEGRTSDDVRQLAEDIQVLCEDACRAIEDAITRRRE